jgi:Flp pilus assembly pilin Flp
MDIRKWLSRTKIETGQTMTEYAVMLGVIVLGVIAAVGVLSLAVSGNFGTLATKIGSLS